MASPEGWADWLGVVGSVASLVSLGVSGYAAWQITVVRGKVSRRILFNVQAPKLASKAARIAKWLTESCDEAGVSDQDRLVEIRYFVVLLNRHQTEWPDDVRTRVLHLEKLAQTYEKWPNTKDMMRIVQEFRVLARSLPDVVEAKHIGGSDDT